MVSYSELRSASRMEIREALQAGMNELTKPMATATPRHASATGG